MRERIEIRQRVAYFAPTANRHYFTRKAAAKAEARAMMVQKYPTQREHRVNGYVTDEAWHWLCDDRLCRLYDRLWRKIYKAKAPT